MADNKEMIKKEISPSQRFTNKVIKSYAEGGNVDLSEEQSRRIQGYFVVIDSALRKADEDRQKKNFNNKNHDYDNPLAYNWNTLDFDERAARAMVASTKMGVDMTLPNMMTPVFFKNNDKQMYNISFIPGYRGREIIAFKYGLHIPESVIIQLVYKNDKFTPHFNDAKHDGDSYDFEVTNPFDRGALVGGFFYQIFNAKNGMKNKLYVLSLADIMKRKPEHASASFWGGPGYVYEKGKRVEKEIAGWLDEMAYKTVANYGFSRITIDPAKIDTNYQDLHAGNRSDERIMSDINAKANSGEVIDTTAEDTKETPAIPEHSQETQQPAPSIPPKSDAEFAHSQEPEAVSNKGEEQPPAIQF